MKYSSDRNTLGSEVSSEDASPEKSDRYIGFRPDKWGRLGAIWRGSTPNTMVAGGLIPGKHANRDVMPPIGIGVQRGAVLTETQPSYLVQFSISI